MTFQGLRFNLANVHTIYDPISKIKASPCLDVVFQLLAFSSILDDLVQSADNMWNLLKSWWLTLRPNFVHNNPGNPDVPGMPERRVKNLFPHSQLVLTTRVTLA